MQNHIVRVCLVSTALPLAGCGESRDEGPASASKSALTASCTSADAGVLPPDAWVCPDPHRIECTANRTTPNPEVIYVRPSNPATCDEMALSVAPGPFPAGVHTVVVTDSAGDGSPEICRAELTVTDTAPPAVRTRQIELWPPNHAMHPVDIHDCITIDDACDPRPEARILWVTGDEPGDATGDGNTEGDAVLASCSTAQLRAERSGNQNGRVYEIGYVVTDAAGNATQGVCRVVVPHDQGQKGAALAGTPAWRVTAPPACDG